MTDPAVVTATVARNIKALRGRTGWSLEVLAARSGVSKGMLIAIEQARSNPSIATLLRVSDAFGIALPRLLESDDPPTIRTHTAAEAASLWRGRDGSEARLLIGSDLPQQLEMWEWRIVPGDGYDGVAHPAGTRELVWVLDGELTLRLGDEQVVVPAGGSALYVGDRPHRYANEGDADLRFAMAVSQPAVPVP